MTNWMPTRFTPSLTGTEEFITDGDKLIAIVEQYWKEQDVEGKFILDDWQKWIIRHALERYPDDWPDKEVAGRLRYRQLVISMGRQNGKSILGAIFGVYGLLFHEYAPSVVGVAYSAQTARVVYDRVSYTLNNVKQFSKVTKVTKTQGIKRLDKPGNYIIKPNSDKAIQGFPITLCIYDEVHITSEKLWDAATEGTKTKKNGLVLGITTAGDDDSSLLKRHYVTGQKAIDNPDDPTLQRFGFFCWEAPEGSTVDNDEAIMAANPAVACGRVSLSVVKSNAANYPYSDQQRYVLNRFVASADSWIELGVFNKVVRAGLPKDAKKSIPITFGIDASTNMEYVTITANGIWEGKPMSRIIGSLVKPTKESLLETCLNLSKNGQVRWAMDGYVLKWLGDELKSRGVVTYVLSTNEVSEACSTFYRMIVREECEIAKRETLQMQVPRAVRKNYGDQWRISRQHSSIEIDALMATLFGLYIVDRKKEVGIQLF